MKIFITVLGAGGYRDAEYYLQGNPEKTFVTRFSPIATLKLIKEKPELVVVLMTEKAKEANWEDSDGLNGMESELRNIGYNRDERSNYAYKPVVIPEGFSREELEEIVKTIFDEIPDKAVVYFDITHSFRHLPMLVMLLLHYAKITKSIKVGGVYYGAYEVFENKKPILNLKFFSELQDWTRAVARFINAGDPSLLMEFAYEELKSLARDDELARRLRTFIEKTNALVNNIKTLRGIKIFENKEGVKAVESYQKVKNLYTKSERNFYGIYTLLVPLTDLIYEKIDAFKEQNNIRNLLYAAEYSFSHRWYQHAATFLYEYLIARLGQACGILWNDFQKFKALYRAVAIIRDEQENQEDKWRVFEEEKPIVKKSLETDFAKKLSSQRAILDKLGQLRNDLNHAGLRPDSRRPETIENELKNILETVKTW